MFLDYKEYNKDCNAISIANVSRETMQCQVPDKTLAGRQVKGSLLQRSQD